MRALTTWCRRPVVGIAACAIGIASMVGAPMSAAAATRDPLQIQWDRCPKLGSGIDCAVVKVPLDYTKPRGKQISLAVARIAARKPAKKIGSLLFNVGGPGFGEVDRMSEVAGALPDQIRDRFDLVGWDPRGTGRSRAVNCDFDMEALLAADSTPDTQEELSTVTAENSKLVAACEKKHGTDFLRSIGTDSTIRDLERLRVGVGDRRLTFLGFSYGTYIGAKYAAKYPNRIRAMIFDGPVDPTLSAADSEVSQRAGFQHAFNVFLEQCAERSNCPLNSGDGPRSTFDAARARSEAGTITATRSSSGTRDRNAAPASVILTAGMFDTGIAEALYYGDAGYSLLERAIADAAEGDGSNLLLLADEYNQRQADGTYSPELQAFQAIYCVDHVLPTAGEWQNAFEESKKSSPDFGGSGLLIPYWCSSWPVHAPKSAAISFPKSFQRTLVIAASADPATPLTEGKGLAKLLPNSLLMTVDSAEHTNAFSGNSCVDRVWVRYLISQKLPAGRQMACGA
ncbi:MAG: alpha/beta hydrolase [Acidimicrobiia bacterium]